MVRSYRKEALPSVYNVEDIPEWDITEHSSMQVLRGQNLMVGFSTLGPDLDELSSYSHPWEQITMVTQGSGELLVGEQITSVSEGDVFAIPPAVEHGVRVTSDNDCKLIDFWPLVERSRLYGVPERVRHHRVTNSMIRVPPRLILSGRIPSLWSHFSSEPAM